MSYEFSRAHLMPPAMKSSFATETILNTFELNDGSKLSYARTLAFGVDLRDGGAPGGITMAKLLRLSLATLTLLVLFTRPRC